MALRQSSHQPGATKHYVVIRVEDEPDLVKRASILFETMIQVVMGRKLVDTLEANFDQGCMRLVVEAADIRPATTPAHVQVFVDCWPPSGHLHAV